MGAVLEEYAVRYADRVSGWWVDGCYGLNVFNYNDDLLYHYYAAAKKGNPQAMIAFNDGVFHPIANRSLCSNGSATINHCYSSWQDFTCGESDDFSDVPASRFVANSMQWHTLGYLGSNWARPGITRYSSSAMRKYSKMVAKGGGVLTVDVQLLRNGSLNSEQVSLLREAWAGLSSEETIV